MTRRSLIDPSVTLRVDVGPPDRALLDSGELGEGYGFRLVNPTGDDDLTVFLGMGIAFSLAPIFEFGAKVLPLRLSDDAEYLDLEAYARFALLRTRAVDIGLQFVVQVPTFDDFGTSVGVPFLFRFHPRVRLDIGIEIELILEDDDGDPDDEDEFEAHLDLPVALSFNITPRFFLGTRLGFTLYRFDDIEVPVGGYLGYTVGGRYRADLTFAFTGYFGDDPRIPREWELVFGAVGRFQL